MRNARSASRFFTGKQGLAALPFLLIISDPISIMREIAPVKQHGPKSHREFAQAKFGTRLHVAAILCQ